MAEDVTHDSHASPLTAQREDFPRWYQDVVARADGRDSLIWPHRDGLKWPHRDDVSTVVVTV